MFLLWLLVVTLFTLPNASASDASIRFTYTPDIHLANTRMINIITIVPDDTQVINPDALATITLVCTGHEIFNGTLALTAPLFFDQCYSL